MIGSSQGRLNPIRVARYATGPTTARTVRSALSITGHCHQAAETSASDTPTRPFQFLTTKLGHSAISNLISIGLQVLGPGPGTALPGKPHSHSTPDGKVRITPFITCIRCP